MAAPIGCARVPRGAGRRAVDTPAPTGPSRRTSPRACRCRTSPRTISTLRSRGVGGLAQCARRSPHRRRHSEQLQIRGVLLTDEHSRVTQCAAHQCVIRIVGLQLQAVRLAPLAAAASQCHQPIVSHSSCHSHTSRVSESFMWHTLCGDRSRVVSLYTSRRSPALSRTPITRTTPFTQSARNSSSRAEL